MCIVIRIFQIFYYNELDSYIKFLSAYFDKRSGFLIFIWKSTNNSFALYFHAYELFFDILNSMKQKRIRRDDCSKWCLCSVTLSIFVSA